MTPLSKRRRPEPSPGKVLNTLASPEAVPGNKTQTPQTPVRLHHARESLRTVGCIPLGQSTAARPRSWATSFPACFFVSTASAGGRLHAWPDAWRPRGGQMIRRHPTCSTSQGGKPRKKLLAQLEAHQRRARKTQGRKGLYASLPKGLPALRSSLKPHPFPRRPAASPARRRVHAQSLPAAKTGRIRAAVASGDETGHGRGIATISSVWPISGAPRLGLQGQHLSGPWPTTSSFPLSKPWKS